MLLILFEKLKPNFIYYDFLLMMVKRNLQLSYIIKTNDSYFSVVYYMNKLDSNLLITLTTKCSIIITYEKSQFFRAFTSGLYFVLLV